MSNPKTRRDARANRPGVRRAALTAAVVAAAVVLPPTAHAQSIATAQPLRSDSATIASARGTIDSVNTEWLAAMKHQDVASIVAPYADSAVFVLPSGASVMGRDAIAHMMRERFARNGPITGGTIHQDGLTPQGPYIYEWGHATVDYVRDGATTHTPGRYVTVWASDAQGRWRIIRNLSLAP